MYVYTGARLSNRQWWCRHWESRCSDAAVSNCIQRWRLPCASRAWPSHGRRLSASVLSTAVPRAAATHRRLVGRGGIPAWNWRSAVDAPSLLCQHVQLRPRSTASCGITTSRLPIAIVCCRPNRLQFRGSLSGRRGSLRRSIPSTCHWWWRRVPSEQRCSDNGWRTTSSYVRNTRFSEPWKFHLHSGMYHYNCI